MFSFVESDFLFVTLSIQLSGSVEHQRVEWSQGTIHGGSLAVWPLIGQLASLLASDWPIRGRASLGRLAPCGQIGWGFSSDGLFMVRGISRDTLSVHKHCNWHLHQVELYWFIGLHTAVPVVDVKIIFILLHWWRQMLGVQVKGVFYPWKLLYVWHNTNSKYNSNPSYFHKIPLQQSRHSEQLRAFWISQY